MLCMRTLINSSMTLTAGMYSGANGLRGVGSGRWVGVYLQFALYVVGGAYRMHVLADIGQGLLHFHRQGGQCWRWGWQV